MIALNHELQRTTHGRNTGECSLWRLSRASSSAARRDAQDAAGLTLGCGGFSLVKLSRGLTAPALSLSRTAGGWCISRQRRADRDSSPPCRPVLSRVGARQSSRAHLRLQTHRIKTSRHKPSVYPLHRHLVERLSSRLVYGNNRSERAGQWRCQNQTKRMFA